MDKDNKSNETNDKNSVLRYSKVGETAGKNSKESIANILKKQRNN